MSSRPTWMTVLLILGFGASLWAQKPSDPPPLEVIELAAPLPVALPQAISTSASGTAVTNPPPPATSIQQAPLLRAPGYSGLISDEATARSTPSREPEPIPTSVPPALPVGGGKMVVVGGSSVTSQAAGAAWASVLLKSTWVSLHSWAEWFGTSPIRKATQSPHAAFEVPIPGGPRVVLRAGSTRMTLNGVDVMLGFLPQLSGTDLKIHRLDVVKTLQPLLRDGLETLNPTNRVIVLDAGHGGRDAGTTSTDGRTFEKMASLDWARRVQRLLEKQGWTVVMTRTNDQEMALSQRVLLAETVDPALFVSLHFNSAYPVHTRKGIETFCLTPPGMASSVIRDGDDSMGVAFPNNAYDDINLKLAWKLQKSVVQKTGAVDRGVQRARWLGVLRGQRRPAVLVEGGYLSNPEEARKIGDPAYRQQLAEGVAAALADFMPGNH